MEFPSKFVVSNGYNKYSNIMALTIPEVLLIYNASHKI
jgi:hypothetical protein